MNIEKELMKLSNKAYKQNEIPIAAIVTCNGKIVSKAYNKRNKSKKICDHAEIIALQIANKKLKDWRLDECELYSIVRPCEMCKGVIEESRIKKVYYYLENDKIVNKDTIYEKKPSNYCLSYKENIIKVFENIRS